MITWKKAELADIPLVVATRHKAWLSTYRGIYPDEWLDNFDYEMHTNREEKMYQNSTVQTYVVMDGEDCQGYFTFCLSEKPIWRDYHCRLVSLYLLPQYQGMGFGKAILSFILRKCFSAGYDKLFLSCQPQNTNAMNFYRHMGGVVIAENIGNEHPEEDSTEFEFSCIACRKAIAADAQTIVRVRSIIWKETYQGIYSDDILENYDLASSEARFAARIADPAHNIYLYFDGEDCIGYFATGPSNFGSYKDFDLCLNNLYICKEYKGKGLGRRAFTVIAEDCKTRGIDKFFCGCNYHNTPAMAFYAHMGGKMGDTPQFHDNKADDIVHFEFNIGELKI